MKNKTKRMLSFIASTCLLATSLNAFGIYADETSIAGPSDSLNSVEDIVDDIEKNDTTTVTTPTVVTSVEDAIKTVTTSTTNDNTTVTTSSVTSVTTSSDISTSNGTSTTTSTNDITITTSITTNIDTSGTITTSINGIDTTTTFTTTSSKDENTYVSKDIILDLDISGSMAGEPEETMKSAAIEFCEKMLSADPDAKIAIVSYGTSSKIGVEYTNDLTVITDYINSLTTLGVTNMSDSFEDVKFLLDNGTGETKSVIIMADGLPCEGNLSSTGKYTYSDSSLYYDYANYALNYDNDSLKPLATIYTIGFFHNIADNSTQEFAGTFMEDLASDKTKHINADITNLDKAFESIANEILYDIPIEETMNEEEVTTITEKEKTTTTTTTTSSNKDTNSPKTSDNGVASIIVLGSLACALVVTTKKKN